MDAHHDILMFESMGDITKLQEMEQDPPQVPDKDLVAREFAKKLRDVQQLLEHTLEEYEEYRNPKGAGLGTPLDVEELVACAHRISYTTFAPPEYASGQVPLRRAFPPAPQDEQMGLSQLYHAAEMDLGIAKSVSQTLPSETMEGIRIKADESPQALPLPPGIQMPPGWRPGLPIELPNELPPMPPGWKPGDPIPLSAGFDMPPLPPGWKPGDAVVLPPPVAAASRPQDQAVSKPVTPAAPAPPAGVIHVPFVQLDLNPELEDDYGSEYSDDDDGSSDEDDD